MNAPTLLPPDMDAELPDHLDRIPAHCREGLVAYLRYGRRPGHFLEAILSNDLAEACARADEDNQRALFDYVVLLINHAPSEAWGSPGRVRNWIERGRELLTAQRIAGAITDLGGSQR